jgi:hypothetical protein
MYSTSIHLQVPYDLVIELGFKKNLYKLTDYTFESPKLRFEIIPKVIYNFVSRIAIVYYYPF